MKNFIVSVIVVTFSWYLVGSFTAVDFNIGHWSGFGRYMLSVLMVFSVIGLAFYNYLQENYKK